MKTFLKSLLRPQLLETVRSNYSGELKVFQAGRSVYITTGHLTQTGGLIEGLWGSGFNKLCPQKNCTWLILGLAGGTAAWLVSQKYKPLLITGVEIDKEMLNLGKKYFHLGEIPNLTIINSDAQNYLKHLKIKFDYILVDMYIEDKLPTFVYSGKFLEQLSNLGQTVVINHLFYDDSKQTDAKYLTKMVSSYFSVVVLHRTLTNLLLICSHSAKKL